MEGGAGAEGGRRGRGRTLGEKNQAFGHLLRRWIHNTVNRELKFFMLIWKIRWRFIIYVRLTKIKKISQHCIPVFHCHNGGGGSIRARVSVACVSMSVCELVILLYIVHAKSACSLCQK